MPKQLQTTDAVIASQGVELEDMDRSVLRADWAIAFGEAPPHFLSMILSLEHPALQRLMTRHAGGSC